MFVKLTTGVNVIKLVYFVTDIVTISFRPDVPRQQPPSAELRRRHQPRDSTTPATTTTAATAATATTVPPRDQCYKTFFTATFKRVGRRVTRWKSESEQMKRFRVRSLARTKETLIARISWSICPWQAFST
jgi:hypothetical protein